jgi:hypothetical protein
MEDVLSTIRKIPMNLVPTTYETAKEYLDQELLKPEGERDLPREMCMLVVSDIPDDQDIVFKANATNLAVHFNPGKNSDRRLRALKIGQPVLI